MALEKAKPMLSSIQDSTSSPAEQGSLTDPKICDQRRPQQRAPKELSRPRVHANSGQGTRYRVGRSVLHGAVPTNKACCEEPGHGAEYDPCRTRTPRGRVGASWGRMGCSLACCPPPPPAPCQPRASCMAHCCRLSNSVDTQVLQYVRYVLCCHTLSSDIALHADPFSSCPCVALRSGYVLFRPFLFPSFFLFSFSFFFFSFPPPFFLLKKRKKHKKKQF